LTSELERIKILETKISQVIDFIKKITAENDRLKEQVKELRTDRKEYEEAAKKSSRLEESIKKYEEEREALKARIEAIIKEIDKLGL
jgi:FtsZ-binding cell division protein ZapB